MFYVKVLNLNNFYTLKERKYATISAYEQDVTKEAVQTAVHICHTFQLMSGPYSSCWTASLARLANTWLCVLSRISHTFNRRSTWLPDLGGMHLCLKWTLRAHSCHVVAVRIPV